MTAPVVLGLDPAALFGYAIGQAGKILKCGTVDIGRRATQLRCTKSTACLQWLRGLVDEHGVTAICREDSVTSLKGFARGNTKEGQGQASRLQPLIVHAQYAAVIDIVADTKRLRTVGPVNPMTLKSFAQVGRSGGKAEMIRSAIRFYGLELRADDDNAADAAHVCAWAMQRLKVNALTAGVSANRLDTAEAPRDK